MKTLFVSLFFLASQFSPLAHAGPGESVCSLPVGSCVGAGCSFRSCENGSMTIAYKQMPFTVHVPADMCFVTSQPFAGFGKLPIEITKDLRSLPKVGEDIVYTSGATNCSSVPSLNTANHQIPGSVVFTYKHWVVKTPPDCGPGIHPGDSITTYPASIGYPALGSPCAGVVSTCQGDGSGNYDVPPQAFPSCTDQVAIAGACGTANGTTVAVAPSGAALCSAGIASAVTGTGPWNWTCAGQFGGAPSGTCTANLIAPTCVSSSFMMECGTHGCTAPAWNSYRSAVQAIEDAGGDIGGAITDNNLWSVAVPPPFFREYGGEPCRYWSFGAPWSGTSPSINYRYEMAGTEDFYAPRTTYTDELQQCQIRYTYTCK